MDLAKYRNLFLEEATEHLAEMSRSLLALEKDPGLGEEIEAVFRAAHSIKSMAASLEYDSIRMLSHRLEDRMEGVRRTGRVSGAGDLALLFRGLEALENLVAFVRQSGEAPPDCDADLLSKLSDPAAADPPAAEGSKKKDHPLDGADAPRS